VSNARLPKRLLDVSKDKEQPSLYETVQGESGQWVALSYCWGKEPPTLNLTKQTESYLKAGVSLSSMDQTILDAVIVARVLDIKYLWVDALCIFQDEGPHNDWFEESSNMYHYYSSSTVTIAAVGAKSVKDGFLHPRERIKMVEFEWHAVQDVVDKTSDGRTPHFVNLSPSWAPEKTQSVGPLTKRG
jgi:hypothetical protein